MNCGIPAAKKKPNTKYGQQEKKTRSKENPTQVYRAE